MESAVLVIGDVHYGRKTETFNPESVKAAFERLETEMDAIRRNDGLWAEELVVILLGDMVDGSGIYPSQAHHQAETSTIAQGEALADLLAYWLLKQKVAWKSVRVEAVPGNHGRVSKFVHDDDNWDTVFYGLLRAKLNGLIPVTVGAPFLRVKIQETVSLCYHGHGIQMSEGIPYAGVNRRVIRWAGTKLAPFANVIMGHFHTFGLLNAGGANVLLNGTLVTDDLYVRELGGEGLNSWWAFGVEGNNPLKWIRRIEV